MTHGTSITSVRIIRRLFAMSLASFTTVTIGCSGGTDQPELGLVSNTVTFDGTPLSGVAVTFVPDDGRPAIGRPTRMASTN